MYLVRVYYHKKIATDSIRKIKLGDALQWIVLEIEKDSLPEKAWTKITLIDLKNKTLVIKWVRGRDGRPQHPVLPGMSHG